MGEFLEIKLRRCRLFLTEAEIISLLAHDPALWAEAIRRGKAITRARAARERNKKGDGHGFVRHLRQGNTPTVRLHAGTGPRNRPNGHESNRPAKGNKVRGAISHTLIEGGGGN